MRFGDMVLKRRPVTSATVWWWRGALIAQHEADMAQKVGCPCGCHGAASGEDGHAGRMIDAEPYLCSLCEGTGWVKLGRIVERDRETKGKGVFVP